VRLAKGTDFEGAVIAPPYPFLSAVRGVLRHAALGAQDVFYEGAGPYTGEVSVGELKSLGVGYVILGHSERRALGEADEEIARKVRAVAGGRLVAILCVGESKEVRDKGLAAAKKFVARQLRACLSEIENLKSKIENCVIAYEPVWAISTSRSGETETPEDAAEMIGFIKSEIRTTGIPFGQNPKSEVLYGGSVNPENAEGFLSCKEIDGALVGGASLKPRAFRAIVRTAEKF